MFKMYVIKNFLFCDRKLFFGVFLIFFWSILISLHFGKDLSFGQINEKNINENFSYLKQKEIIKSKILIESIQHVIKKQIMFFKEGNCIKAYSYASLSIKFFFPVSDDFCLMVKNSYPMIWSPKEFIFLSPLIINGVVVQEMKFVDNYNDIHFYQYQMRKSGSDWKINGVFKF